MKAWHFSTTDCRLNYGDGRLIKAGITHTVDCEPILCEQGLHGSVRPLDALKYAPGPYVWRVELGGIIVRGSDKAVATERRYLWGYDATPVLRKFARMCALDVIHLWDAPDIVIRYLKTGDERLRAAARDAARVAARVAARDAAWAAAWAARDAARDAARVAARDAARAAAWDARAAARVAARVAARAAAWDARAAARVAARDAQNKRLYRLLMGNRP